MISEFGLHKQLSSGERYVPAPRQQFLAPELGLWRESLAYVDWMSLRASDVFAGRDIQRGDGSAAVLIPGLLAGDVTMREMAEWLRRIGYVPYGSGLHRNAGCPEMSLASVVRAVDRAYDKSGRKVHVIGHSLGGLLARGVAIVRPLQVGQVITLGTPVNGLRVHPFVAAAAESVNGECDGECVEGLQQPLRRGISETNVYSRRDGIVDWRTCFRDDAKSIAVESTHVGMIVNRQVYEAVAGILAPVRAAKPAVVTPFVPRASVTRRTGEALAA